MPHRPVRAAATVLALFAAGVVSGAAVGLVAAERRADPYAELDTLVRVMALVQSTWVDEVATEELVAGAIDGMLDRLDPHSTWLSADTWRDLQQETQGSYSGIGVEVRLTDEGARVTRVIPGSPASQEGLTVGDLILSVDGRRLTADDLHDGRSALLGPRGDRARIEVLREGWPAPRTVEALREDVTAPVVLSGMLDDRVGYVRLAQFQQDAADQVSAALDALHATPGFGALVLDLRDNPGGLLSEAVRVADLFLDGGVIVSTWGRLASEREVHEATPGAVSVPMVVLVNGMSASASEIVAAALQESGRARLVGTHTYGKGSVQTVFEHRDGSALKLTIGRYHTPSGQPVAPLQGRAPDVVVADPADLSPTVRLRDTILDLDLDDVDRARLLDLVDALPSAEFRSLRPDIDWEAPPSARVGDDVQLAAALTEARRALAR